MYIYICKYFCFHQYIYNSDIYIFYLHTFLCIFFCINKNIYIYIYTCFLTIFMCIYIEISVASVGHHVVEPKEIMCGHHEHAPIPGGFGAAAGPNDGWHCALHNLTKAYARACVGWGSTVQLRKQLDQLEMSVQSNPSTKMLGL